MFKTKHSVKMATPPIYNPVVPCVHPIPGGMYPGRIVRFQGRVLPEAKTFEINFQCGPNTGHKDDIAFHIRFRFVEMRVVRNHLTTAMGWSTREQEITEGMPLVRGQPFEALVELELQSFKVALNGVHFCEFNHRLPFERISHLAIDGDVMIQYISFEGERPYMLV